LNGYVQSSSPSLQATSWISNHYIFNNTFRNQKTTSVSFNYINNALQLDFKSRILFNYRLPVITQRNQNGIDAHPMQLGGSINLLKVSLGKKPKVAQSAF